MSLVIIMILIATYWATYIFCTLFLILPVRRLREVKQLHQGHGSKVAELDLLPSHLPPKLRLSAWCYTQMSTPQFFGTMALALETH